LCGKLGETGKQKVREEQAERPSQEILSKIREKSEKNADYERENRSGENRKPGVWKKNRGEKTPQTPGIDREL